MYWWFRSVLFYSLLIFSFVDSKSNICKSSSGITQLVRQLLIDVFPRQNFNVMYEDSITAESLQIGKIFSADGEEVSPLTTVTITTGKSFGKNRVSQNHFHRFLSWSWLNLVVINGNIAEESLTNLTKNVVSRAVEQFYVDYSVIWQHRNFNPNILLSQNFIKLKFKVEVQLNPADDPNVDIQFSTVCFYCNNGEPLRQILKPAALNSFQKDLIFSDFTTNFHGRMLRVTGGIGIPLLMDFGQKENGSWFPRGGFMIDPIFFHVQSKMNFTYTTRVFKTFGSQLENGSFTGFVNELFNGRADIGMAGQSYDRIQAVHFLDPIHIDTVSFATAIPNTEVKWQAIFRAFSWDAWLLFGAICFLIVFPFYIFIQIFHNFKNFNLMFQWKRVSNLKYFRNSFGFIYRPIVEQDLTDQIVPKSDSGKLLMIFWLYTVVIVSVAYKSKLTSLMVIPELEIVPNSFEELAEAKYKIILHHVGGALHKNIQSTSSSTFQKIANRLILEKSMYECLKRSQISKKTGCVSYIHNIIGEMFRNFTDVNGASCLRMAQANVFMTAGSYMLPKSAIYRDSMNAIVANQNAFGFGKFALDKAFKKPMDEGKVWARERPDLFKWSNSDRGPQPIKLGQVKVAFAIQFICFTLASISFGFEKLYLKK